MAESCRSAPPAARKRGAWCAVRRFRRTDRPESLTGAEVVVDPDPVQVGLDADGLEPDPVLPGAPPPSTIASKVARRSTCVNGGIVISVATRRAGGLFYETYIVS